MTDYEKAWNRLKEWVQDSENYLINKDSAKHHEMVVVRETMEGYERLFQKEAGDE
jgi:hypothetical protein